MVDRTSPVSVFVIVILAPGTAEPLGSVTVPTMLAVSWLYAAVLSKTMPSMNNKGIRSV
jgi:hypothetical protein